MAASDPPRRLDDASDSPPNVAHAIVRSAVLDQLEARWDRTITTVVAGAGFGKSVALGQAMRANRARPRGIEAWVSCRAGCESPQRLAASVEGAFGGRGGGRGAPLSRLYAVFADQAPLHVSLVLDDVELLNDAGAALLDDLLRRAPSNLHLVLSGRRLPPLALARFRAADDVVEIGADALRFDEAEVAALAARLHAAPLERDLAGWPALVRLALVAPRRSVDEYLWEEVMRTLAPADREALLALCLLGASGGDEVEAVTGAPFDPDGFCARVPLVHQVGDQVAAHDLWTPYLDGLGSATEIAAASRRVLDTVAARGDPIATGSIALRLGDGPALRRAAVDLVRTTLGSLPVDVAESWTTALRAVSWQEGTIEAELLDCALAHARSAAAPSADRLDEVAARFHEDGDGNGEAVALALGTLAAGARNDVAHLATLAARARTLAADRDEPRLRLLVTGVDAAMLSLGGGDVHGALAILEQPVGGMSPSDRPEALVRLHWHLLLLAGRAGDAAELTADLEPVPGMAAPRELSDVARWLDGDPAALASGDVDLSPDRYRRLSERDIFDQAAFIAVIAASGPDPGPVHEAGDLLDTSPFAVASGPDGALTAAARACRAVVDHDDGAAAAVVARFVDTDPLDPLTDAHLRRSLAVPYVCSPELRRRWDAADLGPSQQRARAAARLLLDSRAGTVPSGPPDVLPSVCTALPLAWSVELAARAAAAGAPWGPELAVRLTDLLGEGVTGEITRRLEDPDRTVRRGAAAVLHALPARPPATVGIRVLGPLEVHHDGRPVDTPEMHRSRVRELLSVLVVERTVSRDRVIDLLWPDLDPIRGRANLRVTLRHLQRVLEPSRGQGSSPYFLRGDAQHLRLVAVPGLDVDSWQAEDLLARSEAARRQGDSSARIEHLRAAVGRWRGGRAFADLERLADLDHVARHLDARLVDAAVTLGELELVGGAVDAAATLADRVLAADPYAERAHRLAVAAYMQGQDRPATAAAVDRLSRMLADLGAPPESMTQIVLRNAAQWLGPFTTAPTPG
jgi:LuxR family transcriptional regulator, maltose regulon positive regulatory protein